ncbi:hypothetical protein IT575_01840 [bacterium]|nr:hypothetical protein [bacterium]
MQGAFTSPSDLLRLWRSALATRAENPLLLYWRRLDAQRHARSPWYARSPGMMLFALLLLIPFCAFLVVTIDYLLSLPAEGIARMQMAQSVVRPILLTAGLIVLAALFFYLLSALQDSARLALSFLEPQPAGRIHKNLDDLLAVSPLSSAEALLGLLLHSLRRLALPLGLLCLACAGFFWFAFEDIAIPLDVSTLTEPSGAAPALLPLIALQTWASGMLAALCSILLLTSLSESGRASVLPVSGPYFFCAGQAFLSLLPVSIAMDSYQPYGPYLAESAGPLLGLSACSVLLGLLALYLARRLPWLRLALGHAPGLPQMAVFALLLGYSTLAGEESIAFALLPAVLAYPVYLLSVFNPLPLLLWLGEKPLFALLLGGLSLCFQLLYALVLSGFAHDAIQRRKWGAG